MKNALKISFITLGFIVLISPTLFMGNKVGFNSCGYRSEANPPPFNSKAVHQYLIEFEEYYLNQLGLNSASIHFNALLKKILFNSSISPNRAVLGQNNWVFYTDKNDGILKSYLHQNLFTDYELFLTIADLEKREKLMKQKNGKYIFAVWPNKSTIYYNFVPARLKKMQEDTLSKLGQISKHIKNNNLNVNFLDIREELFELKKEKTCYFRTDTHWNEEGAFLAYTELGKKLDFTPYPKDSFHIKTGIYSQGDLSRTVGLCNHNFSNTPNQTFSFKTTKNIERIETNIRGGIYEVNHSTKSEKTLLLFRDSYSDFLIQFLSLHFKNCYYVAGGYNKSLIEQLNPDIVVEAKVERYF